MKLKILILLALTSHAALAQMSVSAPAKPVVGQGVSSYSMNSLLTDLKGEPLPAGNAVNEEGSPFYNSQWSRGNLILKNNKKYIDILVKVNLSTDDVHYLLEETETERVAAAGIISEIELNDSEKKKMVRFRCGYPVVGKNDLKTFYEVLADGNATLLKQVKKIMIEEKPFNSATINRRYDEEKAYFLFINNSMVKFKPNKAGLLRVLTDQKASVDEFIKKNKIILTSDNEAAKVVAYYNTL